MKKNILFTITLLVVTNYLTASAPAPISNPAATKGAVLPYISIRMQHDEDQHRRDAYEFYYRYEATKTCLMHLAEGGQVAELRKMIAAGQDCSAKDMYGRTAYEYSQSYYSLGESQEETARKRKEMHDLFMQCQQKISSKK